MTGNKNINFTPIEAQYWGLFAWGLFLDKSLLSYALQDFLSLIQHLQEEYLENLLINMAEWKRKKKKDSNQGSVR